MKHWEQTPNKYDFLVYNLAQQQQYLWLPIQLFYISSMSGQQWVDRLLFKTPKTMILEEDDKLYNMLIKELVIRIMSAVVL